MKGPRTEIQAPSTNSQAPENIEAPSFNAEISPRTKRVSDLDLVAWSFSGGWMLVLGISSGSWMLDVGIS